MDNDDLLKQISRHLYDVALLAASIRRKAASDTDWKIKRAMDCIVEAELILRGIKEQGACSV